ncbi:hypothetical protein [Hafnia alvei]|uniref:hypothetical protein n=1 Tax=Hafnia alvei TaxID=569 RepID=UPI00103973EE|nr:hypothetical protein [Hafnia alvei]QBJ32920.1 hypothetical protein EYZ02_08450 [Hafnia alvei]
MSRSKDILEGDKSCGVILIDSDHNDFSGLQARNMNIGAYLERSNYNNFSNASFVNDISYLRKIDDMELTLKDNVPPRDFERISPTIRQLRERQSVESFKFSYAAFIKSLGAHVSIAAPFFPIIEEYMK